MQSAREQSEPRLGRAIATARTIVVAQAMAVGAFALVGTIITQAGVVEGDSWARFGIVSVAFGALVGSVMYRRISLAPLRLEIVHTTGGTAALINHLVRTAIISAALGEVVGIAGLLMGILAGDTRNMYVLFAAALVTILLSLPRPNGWREAYNEIASRGATPPGAV